MKNIILILIILLLQKVCYGQQQSQHTQYMYNTLSFNPAYAGSQDKTLIYANYRAQWIGLEGAPRTGSLSAHSPIMAMGHGLGINVLSDKIGPATTTTFDVNLSYAIELPNMDMLYFGIRGGGSNVEVDYTKLNVRHNQNEVSGILSQFSPNIGVGFYYQSEKWFSGIAIPTLLETKFYDDIKQSVASEKMHYYLHGGYILDVNDYIKFKPTGLLKIVSGAPISFDLSANFMFYNRFTLGASYRLNSAFSGLASFQLNDNVSIGYAYDYDTSDIRNYSNGSHEIFLRVELTSLVRTYAGKKCWCY